MQDDDDVVVDDVDDVDDDDDDDDDDDCGYGDYVYYHCDDDGDTVPQHLTFVGSCISGGFSSSELVLIQLVHVIILGALTPKLY